MPYEIPLWASDPNRKIKFTYCNSLNTVAGNPNTNLTNLYFYNTKVPSVSELTNPFYP